MNSRPNGNLWRHSSAECVETEPLAADKSADLVIIGGGYTGCSAALEAATQGASACLLEAETVADGGSGRNVGLVNAGLWLPPDALIKAMGREAGERLVNILARAPDEVFRRIETYGIECEATRSGTLHCAHSPSGLKDLEDRYRQGNRYGAPLRLLGAEETHVRTGAASLHGALFDPRAGTIQPQAYCRGLARAARDAGASIHDHSKVDRISRNGGEWLVETNGHSVRTKRLLLATNAYHRQIEGQSKPHFVPVHYSQFATAPIPEDKRANLLPGGEGCWDTGLIMTSFRLDAAGRMILGGVGDLDGPGRAIHHGWSRRKLHTLFPEIGDIPFEFAWQGRIAMTADHVPKILAFGPDAYAPFGYSGRGIGPGTVFGAATARALLSGDEESLPVAPVRSYSERFKPLRQIFYETGATAMHAVSSHRGSP
ncbi:NAD(P)/FAD-dependent oxidoreductase [Notoacmeibacter ruber]|uniref:FAD-binding oxidoreductase n=1 Tax=Notoacmeibacter ruber TaxID=2670375 RepID=A0A3L7JJ83_9HYPH|nr:FAD-dependent oxidoreductase [Notoacmeibacter ruber]RLQ88542.1 FAD-binding oxidoreductase [Notoacmeibacter ruber]